VQNEGTGYTGDVTKILDQQAGEEEVTLKMWRIVVLSCSLSILAVGTLQFLLPEHRRMIALIGFIPAATALWVTWGPYKPKFK
jgi:hypothetical protein